MQQVENFLSEIVKGIVTKPDEVQTHVSDEKNEDGNLTLINVKVAKEDVGLCIGEKGKTAEAIRRVVGLYGFQRLKKRVYVKIDAPKVPRNHFDYEKEK